MRGRRAVVREPRLIFIHGFAPPNSGGTAIIVDRLLGRMAGVTLEVWTRVTQLRAVRRGNFVLPGRYRYFVKLRSASWAPLWIAWPITLANVVLAIAAGVRIGRRARRDGADWLVSVVDEGFSQIAGSVAARIASVPLLLWVFDVWEENAYAAADRRVAHALEGRLWRSASAVMVHAEELAEHYQRKHGVDAVVIRTPIEGHDGAAPHRPPGADHGAFEVLVAGSVYWAQAEALQRVASAVRMTPGASLTIVGDPALQSERIDADRYEPPLSGAALRARLAKADLLVLGLSFDSPWPEVIRTATPARLPEYLAAGVPLLVHAPAGSHVAEYVRRGELGAVVDSPDVEAVAAAISAARREVDGQRQRAVDACAFALSVHAESAVRADFKRMLEALRHGQPLASFHATRASTGSAPSPNASTNDAFRSS
jgi:glycosyltransferase involved in cell wall biosynthesis